MARLTETEKQQLLDATRRNGPRPRRKLLSLQEYAAFLRANAAYFPRRAVPPPTGDHWKL